MLIFLSAFVSPHTLPFGVALTRYYDKVIFINTKQVTQERKRMGYEISDARVQIHYYFDDPEGCQKLIDEAKDVILAGIDFSLISHRVSNGKSVFVFHERIFKKGIIKLLDPRTWSIAKFCYSVRGKNVYLLAVGENAAKDFRRLGFNKKKIYRFGYFPATTKYSPECLKKGSESCRVLWVGRFVDFKRPVMAVKAFKRMGENFQLIMVGDGKLFDKTKAYANRHGVSVSFLGNVSAAEVEKQMLKSHILLSTSDKGEGWGAVINEAMNRGCAVVCAKQIGCADSLATKENSVLYKTFSVRDLRRALQEAWQNHPLLSEKGYETITCYFNAEVAAQRFASFAEDGVCEWDNGLCSRVYK